MKNSKEYSKKIKKLYSTLKHKYPKIKKTKHDELIYALVYGIIAEELSDSSTESAMKRFKNHFVDLNDLRVSSIDEIVEQLGEDNAVTQDMARRLVSFLRAVFNKYHTLNLEDLKKGGKRPAKQALEKLNGSSSFMVDYCMLTALDGHAIPLTKPMIGYLKDNDLVYKDADEQDIEGFLTRQIPASNGYEFYQLLRRVGEASKKKKKKAVAAKKKVKKTKKSKVKKAKSKTTKKAAKKKTKKKAKKVSKKKSKK